MSQPDEGVLDPWVEQWMEANSAMMEPPAEYTAEYLALTRPKESPFPTRPLPKTTDDVVAGVPVRIYEHDQPPTGLIVYFHGGGFCSGSIGLMEIIATELAHCSGAAVVSVEYRLAPEHPYPAGLDDCEAVTRWAVLNTERFGTRSSRVTVAGESAGGNLAAAVSLRLREAPGPAELAAQVLIYPVLDRPSADYGSRRQFDTPMLRSAGLTTVATMYCGGEPEREDPYIYPLQAEKLAGLPPAFVVLGGCDVLRDEGRRYARRLQDDGVPGEELSCPGQPHGFMNLGFPAAQAAYDRIGLWLKQQLSAE